RLLDQWLLAGDDADVAHGGVECFGIGDRLAHADVDTHLGYFGHLHRVGIIEVLDQRGHHIAQIALVQAWLFSRAFGLDLGCLGRILGHAYSRAICSPEAMAMRTLVPLASWRMRTRVGLLVFGS